jgi:hypothetical protein
VTRSHELPRQMKPVPWDVLKHFSAPSLAVPRRHRFGEFEAAEEQPNLVTGFAGEYFVHSSVYEVINVPGLQISRKTSSRFHIPKLDQFPSTIR